MGIGNAAHCWCWYGYCPRSVHPGAPTRLGIGIGMGIGCLVLGLGFCSGISVLLLVLPAQRTAPKVLFNAFPHNRHRRLHRRLALVFN